MITFYIVSVITLISLSVYLNIKSKRNETSFDDELFSSGFLVYSGFLFSLVATILFTFGFGLIFLP